MESFTVNHSLKDIPLPTLNEYLENLVDQISKFMRRLKWSLYFKLNPDIKPEQKETYGFKSRNAPPQFNSQNFGEHYAALNRSSVRVTLFRPFLV